MTGLDTNRIDAEVPLDMSQPWPSEDGTDNNSNNVEPNTPVNNTNVYVALDEAQAGSAKVHFAIPATAARLIVCVGVESAAACLANADQVAVIHSRTGTGREFFTTREPATLNATDTWYAYALDENNAEVGKVAVKFAEK